MNRNRVNKKRMGRARVLSRAAAGMLAAALCFQPMTALAGPAGDSSLTSSSSNAGPAAVRSAPIREVQAALAVRLLFPMEV